MIRQGTLSDAKEMAEIFNYYVATSTVIFSNRQLSAEEFADKIRDVVDWYPFFIAETESGEMAGYCYAHRWMPDPVYGRSWEVTIYLNHNFTGMGFGRQLLEAVIAGSRAMGAHTLVSCITAGNHPCERLHQACGFKHIGTFPEVGYKFDQYLDDALYQIILQ